jgi:hypothetical protein
VPGCLNSNKDTYSPTGGWWIDDAARQLPTCKPARNIDHFLKSAGVVIQCVAVPTGVQRWRLFTACTAAPPPADCAYNGTAASSINLWGTVAGYFSGADGVLHGFWRAANGSVSTFDALGAGSATFPTSVDFWGR